MGPKLTVEVRDEINSMVEEFMSGGVRSTTNFGRTSSSGPGPCAVWRCGCRRVPAGPHSGDMGAHRLTICAGMVRGYGTDGGFLVQYGKGRKLCRPALCCSIILQSDVRAAPENTIYDSLEVTYVETSPLYLTKMALQRM